MSSYKRSHSSFLCEDLTIKYYNIYLPIPWPPDTEPRGLPLCHRSLEPTFLTHLPLWWILQGLPEMFAQDGGRSAKRHIPKINNINLYFFKTFYIPQWKHNTTTYSVPTFLLLFKTVNEEVGYTINNCYIMLGQMFYCTKKKLTKIPWICLKQGQTVLGRF